MRFLFETGRHHTRRPVMATTYRPRRRYGLIAFLFDLFMVCITGGFWLIWIFAREMRNR